MKNNLFYIELTSKTADPKVFSHKFGSKRNEMPVIGKLIKQTNAISYKRNLKKKKDFSSQREILTKHILKARKTAFGQFYRFDTMSKSPDLFRDFQTTVPIRDYDAFYSPWLEQCLEGKRDVLWPGKIVHYALSSGTTGSPSKRIPVSTQMIRSFQKASISQLSSLHELDLPEDFFQAQFLTVGGSTDLVKCANHVEGDLSGILRKYAPIVASPFTKPNKKISKQKDWNVKLEMMIEKAPEWNIGIIAGVPSWCILLMEKIIERYQLNNIHDIWPNLQVYVHGGVFMDPYEKRVKRLFGKEVYLLDTYLASEGYFAFQTSVERKGMQLLLDTGTFFEFVPFNSDYFDADGNLRDTHSAFTIDEVQPEMDYALVVTTNAGLWRYLIGDLVRFTDIERSEIIISGRIKQFLSLCGEHLSLDNINRAIQDVSEHEGVQISEFTIVAHEEELTHHWYLGVDVKQDAEQLMQRIDERICALNDDYRSARKINLKKPQISVIPTEKFYEFLEKVGKSGSQHKFPRVLSKKQKQQWLEFLSC